MEVEYFYCPNCGYEDYDIFVSHAATYANGDFYYCPACGEESSHVEYDNYTFGD